MQGFIKANVNLKQKGVKIMFTNLNEVLSVSVPPQTDSYVPVSNKHLIDSVKNQLSSNGLSVSGEQYEISKNGLQMFGSMSISTNSSVMVKEFGFRNSYDKSLPVGFVSGSKVLVCSNLMFRGDIILMRKHTLNVYSDFEKLLSQAVSGINTQYNAIQEEYEKMNRINVSDKEAAHLTGEMYFKNKIKDTHVSIIKKEWKDTYTNKTAWDFCQCTTEALKKHSVRNGMNMITQSYNYLIQHFNLN